MQPHPLFATIIETYAKAKRPAFHEGTAVQAREMLRASMMAAPPATGLPALQEVVEETVEGPHGPIPVRRYRPLGEVLGTCVYFHSGGWIMGDLSSGDGLCRRLAGLAQFEMINVDYRLAPEHPYPAPLEDAWAVVTWASRNRTGALIVAGESAGGNLAAAVAIRARDAGGPMLDGQFLAYPVTDAGMQTDSYRENGGGDLLLSAADMGWFWDQYCPPSVDRGNALVAPLRVPDAAGLPATLLMVAELDPLRDEGLAYAARLAAAGVPMEMRRDAGMVHGYLNFAGLVETAADAVRQAAGWMVQQAHGHNAAR